MTEQLYKIGIGLSVVPYIGPDLYSNVPAVISELIANSWDASATRVDIKIDIANDIISIRDNGKGMNQSLLNSNYLRIGYKKRVDADTHFVVDGQYRHVMGRKGIGKLAPFALADELEIHSTDGTDFVGCIIKWEDLQDAIDKDQTEFLPIAVSRAAIDIELGTCLILRAIKSDKHKIFHDLSIFRKQVARRFTVIESRKKFDVRVNDKSITDEDRPYIDKLQFVWSLGSTLHPLIDRCANLIHKLHPPSLISNTIEVNNGQIVEVNGWIGTVSKPSDISLDHNNTIAIFAHGKLIQEDILEEMDERMLFARYVVGNVEANFLDTDENDDIITPDRQRLNQNDLRYIELKKYLKTVVMPEIRNVWSLWRSEIEVLSILTIPEIKNWYLDLNKAQMNASVKFFKRILQVKLLDESQKIAICHQLVPYLDILRKRSDILKIPDKEFLDTLDEVFIAQSNGNRIVNDDDSSGADLQPDNVPPSNTQNKSNFSTSSQDNLDIEISNMTTGGDQQPDKGEFNNTNEDRMPSSINSSSVEASDTTIDSSEQQNKDIDYRDDGYQPTSPPTKVADETFKSIRMLIKKSDIEKKFKSAAIKDLQEAQKIYQVGAYKACVVMLGAVLEGMLLGVLRKPAILAELRKNSSIYSKQTKALRGGGLGKPEYTDDNALADAIAEDLQFENYKQLVEILIPDIKNAGVDAIQKFRNAIHPWRAIKEPNLYEKYTFTRAMTHITSLQIIIDYLLRERC